jgi:zinc ribbon protein
MNYPFIVNSKTQDAYGMYCPRCGAQASQTDTKFCRACGADLTLVFQAIAGQISWRTHLLTRLDNFFLSRREYEERESAREGRWNLFLGASLLGISIMSLVTGEGGPTFWVVLMLFSLISLKVGIGNLRLYKRYLRGTPPEVKPNKGDLTLLKIDHSPRVPDRLVAQTKPGLPASVTEKTTELLSSQNDKTQHS